MPHTTHLTTLTRADVESTALPAKCRTSADVPDPALLTPVTFRDMSCPTLLTEMANTIVGLSADAAHCDTFANVSFSTALTVSTNTSVSTTTVIARWSALSGMSFVAGLTCWNCSAGQHAVRVGFQSRG